MENPAGRCRQVAVEMEGKVVRIEITCADYYGAIKLYEELIEGCKSGNFTLEMEVDQ
jgi:hypothetical protein